MSKTNIRDQIIKQITQIYAPDKIFNYLVKDLVSKSKNARQRTDCLEWLGQMIEALGLNPFNPSVTLRELAKQIGDRDNSVRNAALNTITISYQIAGDQMQKLIGKLNEKDQCMIDERIKRSCKPAPNDRVKLSPSGHYSTPVLEESLLNEAIILVITGISNMNIEMSVKYLDLINLTINNKKQLLIPHMDNLLNTCQNGS